MEYKELLLKTAVCAITADGVIDERETKSLYHMEKSSPYFSSDDLKNTLKLSLDNCSKDIKSFLDATIDSISKENLNPVQELTLIEISLRIIKADNIVAEAEQEFIKKLRTVLQIDDLIISERFGAIDYLGITAPEGQETFDDKLKPDKDIEITAGE